MILSRYKIDKVLYKKLVPWAKTEEGRREVQRIMDIHVFTVVRYHIAKRIP